VRHVIPVIDLFAGPGGLGEGFSQYNSKNIKFKIALSIEKDSFAHKTLELRSFFRQFDGETVPEIYYEYIQGKISRDKLFKSYPARAKKAKEEAWLHELNEKDITKVRTKTKLALKKFKDNHWVLIGGPPCQAYSLVGRSRIGYYKDDFEEDDRHYLYQHYLRLVAHLSPSIFIMENVKGFLTASAKGEKIFDTVLNDLEYPGKAVKKLDDESKAPSSDEYDIYSLIFSQEVNEDDTGKHVKKLKPQDYIIRSEKYGLPQKRHRVILMGVRKDIDPGIKKRLTEVTTTYSVNDVINDLPKVRSGLTGGNDSWDNWKNAIGDLIINSDFEQIDSKTRKCIKNIFKEMTDELSIGGNTLPCSKKIKKKNLSNWYADKKMGVVCNHEPKSHMKSDLWRYFFSTCFAKIHKRSPILADYPDFLLPDHSNVDSDNKKDAKWFDRFKVQLGEYPGSTVTSHLSKDGHYYIHHDPSQCRAWTVREAARVQTFPDNYFFEGTKTAQYHQVGNAVPPLLANKIADVVAEYLTHMNHNKKN
jgi:DNA (cytosine-5)-methyltransferase 1